MTGVELIAAERKRQIEEEGWTPERDASAHPYGELAVAASVYARRPEDRVYHADQRYPTDWPWSPKWWKPGTRIRELSKAGALIAAELDRLIVAAGGGLKARNPYERQPFVPWSLDWPEGAKSGPPDNDVVLEALSKLRAAIDEGKAKQPETGWLIVRNGNEYWGRPAGGSPGWTLNEDAALRFSRESDAAMFIEGQGWALGSRFGDGTVAYPQEHIWFSEDGS